MEDLMQKIVSNSATEQEKIQFESWLASNSENQQSFEDFKALWSFLGHGELISDVDADASWEKFVAANTSTSKKSFGFMRIAATLLVLLTMGGFFYFSGGKTTFSKKQFGKKGNPTQIKHEVNYAGISGIEVKNLEKSLKKFQKKKDTSFQFNEMILEDSSVATISESSVLKVLDQSPKQPRIASLSGAGLFDIKPTNQDFVLETEQLKIKVQGTKFNVITPTETYNFVEISVEEGFMEVEEKENPNNKITITSNEKYLFDVEKKEFIKVSVPSATLPKSKWNSVMDKLFKKNNYKH